MHCNALSLRQGCTGHKNTNLHSYFLPNFALFLQEMDPNLSNGCIADIHRIKMVIIWREKEHEEQDMIALNNQGMVEALRNCELLKYFRLSRM